MTPTLAFDIEAMPDVRGIRLLYDLPNNLPDSKAVMFARQKRRVQTDGDFMQHHLHQVVAISCCMRWGQGRIHVGTIGGMHDNEEVVIAKFFDLIETRTPQLMSWNNDGFDLPVLRYRSLIHGITAVRYWDTGESDFGDSRDFKWNNYISRYHNRHYDLMNLLTLYQPRASVSLDDMAKLCGFLDKLGMDGGRTWEVFHAGRLKDTRSYRETDATNAYLMYLRFRLMSGALDAGEYGVKIRRLKDCLTNQAKDKPHWVELTRIWRQTV